MHDALFYDTEKEFVQCKLCPHNCIIKSGKTGICGVRKNVDNKLISLVYGKSIAYHIDPIEKKPLFHVFPGTNIFSFSTVGCNFKCDFCQNWDISQEREIKGTELSPEKIIEIAIENNCNSIAMTYNEPTIFFEYAYDTCRLAKEKKLITVFVSNGYINKEPIKKISKYLDAINIDLKSFSDEFYKKHCGGRLQPVLDSINEYHKNGVWVEITTLVIPGENDSEEELQQIAEFIVSIDKNIPWHISRFHPDYKMRDKNWTPIETLVKAHDIGKKAGLNHVYMGNVPGNKFESTFCPRCNKLLIERSGYTIIKQINCKCGKIKGIF